MTSKAARRFSSNQKRLSENINLALHNISIGLEEDTSPQSPMPPVSAESS
jgi:hypothetical protein